MEFDPSAFEDLDTWWIQQDRKKALHLVKLIKEVQRTPFIGTGVAAILSGVFFFIKRRMQLQEERIASQSQGNGNHQ